MREDELFEEAKALNVPYELVEYVHHNGRIPVVNFAAGGIATPADAALMMQLGAEGVFVGSGIFKSGDPRKRAEAIVKAVTNFEDYRMLASMPPPAPARSAPTSCCAAGPPPLPSNTAMAARSGRCVV